MDRRDALKVLTTWAGATGMTVTPVTTHDASTDIGLLIIKVPGFVAEETVERLRHTVEQGLKGTPLEGVRAFVLGDGMDLEIVRTRKT